MQCHKCNRQIPAVAIICPYCSTPVKTNNLEQIEFGDISNIDYDDKNDLKTSIEEPRNRKIVVMAILTIILVFAIFLTLIYIVFFPSKEKLDTYFLSTLDHINSYIEKNFLEKNGRKSGEYKLTLTINGKINEINGHYAKDIENKILKIDGIMQDPNEHSNDVILDNLELIFNTYIEENQLYFKSDQLFDTYLTFPISDKFGLLTAKYNRNILLNGVNEALKNSLSQVNYKKENTNINYRGIETNTNRYYFVLDNQAQIMFIRNFYDYLINDTDFIDEYANIKRASRDEIIQMFKKKVNDSEANFALSTNSLITFSIYVSKDKIIRYHVDIIDKEHQIYQLDIKDGKYYFDYFLNDKNEVSSTLIKIEKDEEDGKFINYAITLDNDKYVMDIVLDFKEDEKTVIEKENIINFRELSTLEEEDRNILKTNLLKYTNNDDLINFIVNYSE